MKKSIYLTLILLLCSAIFIGCGQRFNPNTMGVSSEETSSAESSEEPVQTGDESSLEAAAVQLLTDYKNSDEDTFDTIYEMVRSNMRRNYVFLDYTEYLEEIIDGLLEGVPEDDLDYDPDEVNDAMEYFEYEVTDVSISGTTGTVKVSTSTMDMGGIISHVFENDLEDDEGDDYINGILNSNDVPILSSQGELTFTYEDGEWVLTSIDNNFADTAMFGLINWLEELINSLGGAGTDL